MPDSVLLPFFLVGLLGGVHCVGMCGGIVGALSFGGPARWSMHLAYNAGRIVSYTCAGALAGSLGAATLGFDGALPVRLILYVLANAMLLALGVYLLGMTRSLAFTERAGQFLWRWLQPLGRRFLPARSPGQAFPLGLVWGWLPCGLVYSALVSALTTGSTVRGAMLMLAFGLGTLPNLLLAGIVLARLGTVLRRPMVRLLSGLLVLAYGLWGMLGVARLANWVN